MADQTNIIDNQVNVVDKATGPLSKIASAVGRVDSIIGKLGSAAMGLGGIGGMLKITEAIGAVNNTYKAVGRIKTITGVTAEEAHSLLDAFELGGVEDAESIITKMTKKAQTLEGGMGGGVKQVERMKYMYQKLGIAIDAGPKETLLGMATAAQKGQINFTQMSRMLGVSGQQAVSMWGLMQKGPETIRKDIDASLKGSDLITEAALKQHKEWGRSKRELADSFEGIVGTVYKKLLPGLTKMVQAVKEGIDKWQPAAERFANYLTEHMDKIIAGAKVLLKMLAAQKMLSFAGLGGVAGVIKRVGGYALGSSKAGGAASAAAGIAGKLGGMGGIFSAISSLGPTLLRFSVVGVIVAGIVKLFASIWEKSEKVREVFTRIWNTISAAAGGCQRPLARLGCAQFRHGRHRQHPRSCD
jgi:hypothetical protein